MYHASVSEKGGALQVVNINNIAMSIIRIPAHSDHIDHIHQLDHIEHPVQPDHHDHPDSTRALASSCFLRSSTPTSTSSSPSSSRCCLRSRLSAISQYADSASLLALATLLLRLEANKGEKCSLSRHHMVTKLSQSLWLQPHF